MQWLEKVFIFIYSYIANLNAVKITTMLHW